jgi:hypothetical protein
VAAVVQQVAQRRRRQAREHQVEVGEIAGQRASRQQQAVTGPMPRRVRLGRQRTLDQLADSQPDDSMRDVIHAS